jgi:hypothetical protein
VTGLDPTVLGTASLAVQVTHTGGSLGGVLWGDFGADDSLIRIPSPDVVFRDGFESGTFGP